MKKRILALLLCLTLTAGAFAGCGGNSGNVSDSKNSSSAASANSPEESDAAQTGRPAGPDDTSEPYSFSVYYNYTGWNRPWGQDEASKYMSEKFNIDINWWGPDSDPDSKLNLMVSSDDLSDMIVLNRDPTLNTIARAGMLQDLSQYMWEGNDLEANIAQSTLDMLKIDGVNYGIPNWARSKATGGNYQWIVDAKAYEAAGTPVFETLEDLHQYALAVKEANLTSYSGASMHPVMFGNADAGYYVYYIFYRSLGAPNLVDNYYTQENGKIQFCMDSDTFVEALRIANQWYNEGLFTAETFTDNTDQFLEKVTNGRAALMFYDFTQDDVNQFRRMTINNSGNSDSYEVVGYSYKYDTLMNSLMFPAIEKDTVTYGDENTSVGWNVNCITTKAENPQRIFDWCSWMLSPEGSVTILYGPEGGSMLESVDYSTPVPTIKLKKDSSEFTDSELTSIGASAWCQPANSDWFDAIKFTLNDAQEPEKRNWAVDIMAHLTSYDEEDPKVGQKMLSDQCVGLPDTLEVGSDEAVARRQIFDSCKEYLPKIMMAGSAEEFDALCEQLRSNAHSAGVDSILSKYQERFDDNIATQGFNCYSDEYDYYKLHQ